MSYRPATALSAIQSGRPSAAATVVLLSGIVLTSLILPSGGAVNVFTAAAVGIGLFLALATGIEATSGVRSLIRVDILMLWVLYGLTLLEFLFPQPDIDPIVSPAAATDATDVVLLGFGGVALGRHLISSRRGSQQLSPLVEMRPASIFLLFTLAAVLGYLHIFLAVNFDLLEVLRQMSLPRFAQSWGRGRYGGDVFTLLVEIGSLIYLIPPIAGLICARSREYTLFQKSIVTIVLVFTFYFGFASGTRNIIATYLVTFVGAYLLNKPGLKLSRALCIGIPALILLLIACVYMLKFRQFGLSDFSFTDNGLDALYIDHNMVVISRLTDAFPNLHNFLGFEVPFNALVHPIPRILWPGKPEGLSVSIESVVGASGELTVAATFVGEAYIAGGVPAVLFASLAFGAAAAMWNRVGQNMTSPFWQVLYASGFFCAMISMRSIMWGSVTMLPTLALWLYGNFWLTSRSSVRRNIEFPGTG